MTPQSLIQPAKTAGGWQEYKNEPVQKRAGQRLIVRVRAHFGRGRRGNRQKK